ncbi:twin-arginine translocation signal domain-containing protein, partial [Burkholderia gladioli]|nr:twin-arginine translocation signal domain-containing protein [Burkholderia gladioli]
MKRRDFLGLTSAAGMAGAAGLPLWTPSTAFAGEPLANPGAAHYERLLILVELKGGNDGLNTVVPYDDPLYRAMRPTLGLRREAVLPLDQHAALHPALAPL